MANITPSLVAVFIAGGIVHGVGTASAQSIPGTPSSGFNWQGFYAGGSLGSGRATYRPGMSFYRPAGFLIGGIDMEMDLPELEGDGGLGALQLGYNFLLGERFLAGVQVDAALTSIDYEFGMAAPMDVIGMNYGLRPLSMVTVAGRLGFLPTSETILYGLLGYNRGSFRGEYDMSVLGSTIMEGGYDFNLDGAAIGLGFETVVGRNVTLGVEYRYNRFNRHSFMDLEIPLIGPNGDFEMGFNTSVQTVRATLNYHF